MVGSVDYDVDSKDYLDFFDFPLEDIDGNSDKDFWNDMLSLELPSDMSTMCFSSALSGGIQSDFNDNKSISMSYDRTCRPNEFPSGAGTVLSDDSSSDVKPTHLFKSSSPVSILESTSSCFTENMKPTATVPAKRARTKRSRSRPSNFTKLHTLPLVWAAKSSASETVTLLSGKSIPNKKHAPLPSPSVAGDSGHSGEGKRCTHCEVTSTPQWREGPMGPKTLCNACGVRFRSGRLFPEYRPAASPTFVASVHSNSHKKVVEMRSKAERTDGDGRAGVQLHCRSQAGDSVRQLIV